MGPKSWVLEEIDVDFLLAQIDTAAEVVIDFETTGLDEHAQTGSTRMLGGRAARVALATLTLPQEGDDPGRWDGQEPTTWILPLSHPASPFSGRWRQILRDVLQMIRTSSKAVVNQNMKFDARWGRATTGVDLAHLIAWDTQVSSHLLDETRSTKLKVRASDTFGIPRWDDGFDFSKISAEETDLFELGEYAANDTYWAWRLAQEHREQMWLTGHDGEQPETPDEVVDARLGKVAVWVAMPTVASLTKIEQRGMGLDVPWVREHLAENEAIAAAALVEIAQRYSIPGEPSTAATSHYFKAWVEASIANGGLHIAAMTPNGAASWGKAVLRKQARQAGPDSDAALILRQRSASKLAEFLRSWLSMVSADSRIHANYNVGSIVTGRLSSSDPNMQQVTKVLKPAFVPAPGFVIADFDYSQVELRVAAFVSRSQPMIDAYQRGDDLHKILATKVTSKPLADITPDERQAGKSANFGLLYGMGVYGFQRYAEDVYGVVMTEEEAATMHRAFFETWVGIREWHAKQIARAHATGQVVSPIGRVRRLPGIFDSNPKMVSYSERSAINSPVQGFASDLMQMAAASIQGVLPGHEAVEGVHIVGTVHDSIVVELPEYDWQRAAAECRFRMETGVIGTLAKMGVDFDVPLVADATVGTRWGLHDVSDPDVGALEEDDAPSLVEAEAAV
jgi:DNA polymerase I-like protein with 3'-5' exonuclease and polymerase domains